METIEELKEALIEMIDEAEDESMLYIKPTDKNMNLQVHIYRRCTFKYLN